MEAEQSDTLDTNKLPDLFLQPLRCVLGRAVRLIDFTLKFDSLVQVLLKNKEKRKNLKIDFPFECFRTARL